MNIPVFAVYFATYEHVKRAVSPYLAYEGVSKDGAEVFSPQVFFYILFVFLFAYEGVLRNVAQVFSPQVFFYIPLLFFGV
jgi:hypothetical protein